MKQFKYINVVEVLKYKGTSYAELVKVKKQTTISHMASYIVNDLFLAESRGEKFIEVPSDKHKELIVRVEDIVSIYTIDNPEYKKEEVE